MQETMAAMAKSSRGSHVSVSKLNNVLMQMRKNCNHPDLIKGAFDGSITYPSAEEIRAQCGKMQLLERMLHSLHKGGHKVLIFSQVRSLSTHAVAPSGSLHVDSNAAGRGPFVHNAAVAYIAVRCR